MKKLILTAALASGAFIANAQFLGPTAYLSTADSPWAGKSGFDYFFLDNFEAGKLTAPGVTASAGSVIGPSGSTDSVDGDDGTIDGFGISGHSFFFLDGSGGVTWTFFSANLGKLPTHAGIVWTDGQGTTTFEAWDEMGKSLGTVQGNHADNTFGGRTGEDRFYGMIHSSGISKIRLTNSSGGIEMDHLQFGYAVPEPGSMIALGIGACALLLRRRR